MENSSTTVTLETTMTEMRATLKPIGEQILAIKKTVAASEVTGVEDRNEELANLTIAYRHMEDCIMRLGKVIQAFQGGKSIYDKPSPGESAGQLGAVDSTVVGGSATTA